MIAAPFKRRLGATLSAVLLLCTSTIVFFAGQRPAPSAGSTVANPLATAPPRDSAVWMEFVKIAPGEFMMGCPRGEKCRDDEKRHRVRITKGFEIGKYEVTQAQWESVMGANPSGFEGADRPVESVSWDEVQEFLKALNARQDGYRYRLPTEAEWEYAARAGTTRAYAGSLDSMAWYGNNSGRAVLNTDSLLATGPDNFLDRLLENGNQTHPVGQKQPSAWGLYDMHGNVWEWVQDWYDAKYYRSSPARDPTGPASGQDRVVRGGSWGFGPGFLRVDQRYMSRPGLRSYFIGFRCVREAISMFLEWSGPEKTIRIEGESIHMQTRENTFDNPVSAVPSSTRIVKKAGRITSTQVSALRSLVEGTGFWMLQDSYGAPEAERFYPYRIQLRFDQKMKTVVYRSNPAFPGPPEAFKQLEIKIAVIAESVKEWREEP